MEFTDVRSSEELMRAQTELYAHIFNHIDSMSLKCAVELGIPDAIHSHGKPMPLSELLSALSISPAKAAHMRRLMAMLAHSGMFSRGIAMVGGGEEDAYSLTALSRLLVTSNRLSLSEFVVAMFHPALVDPFQSMSAWFRGDKGADPLATHYGCGFWDLTARDAGLNKVFNDGMASDTGFLMDVLLKDCRHVFEGIDSLVDVGGGTGAAATAISIAFPHIKCSVLDLPQVVAAAAKNEAVDFIAGDMFDCVPPADAVLLKWMLHVWNDEECVKILKRCKEAISGKKDGPGKVIIVEQVLGSDNSHPSSGAAQLYFDILLMVTVGGIERGEQEWKKIFIDAGYTNYKITLGLGPRSVIELYP